MATAQDKILRLFEQKRAYFALLDQLKASESVLAKKSLSKQITIAYDMVILELNYAQTNQTYCQIRYWKNKLYDAYCEDKARIPFLEALIPKTDGFETPSYWQNTTIQQQLAMVEAITSESEPCVGYDILEILVTESFIEIKQNNHRNATSIDHKDNYMMWDLEFNIPLVGRDKVLKNNLLFDEYAIGTMRVSFSDRSKPKMSCAETVLEKIKELAAKE